MDPVLVALATTAATTLVAAMTQDGWDETKRAIVAYRRSRASDHASLTDYDLDAMRTELLQARTPHTAQVRNALVDRWRQTFESDLRNDLRAESELRTLAEKLAVRAPVVGTATHHGTGDINIAGHSLTVNKSVGDPLRAAEDQS